MEKVTVFLLSSNRPNFIGETIDSIAGQSSKNFKLIVSDNSSNDEVEKLIKNKYQDLSYIRRTPRLPALEHFKTVLSEVKSEYFVIFHDDDLMHEDYISRMVEVLDQDASLSAVGCNAWIIKDDNITKRIFFQQKERKKIIRTNEDLITPYLRFLDRVAPFPGYMYRTEKVKGLFLDASEGGKYSDTSFLMKVAARSSICWLKDPLMYYRFHSGNDSGENSIPQHLRLLRFIFKNTSLERQDDLINQYKFAYWLKWILNRDNWKASSCSFRKFRVIATFVFFRGSFILIKNPAIFKRIIYNKIF